MSQSHIAVHVFICVFEYALRKRINVPTYIRIYAYIHAGMYTYMDMHNVYAYV